MPQRCKKADTLTNKGERKKLDKRVKPYTRAIREGLLLGYLRTGDEAGRWLAIERSGTDDRGRPKYSRRALGTADDLTPADGRTVLTYDQAVKAAGVKVEKVGPSTVREASKLYLARQRASKGEKAEKDAKQKLDSRILPVLGDIKIAELTTTKIQQWHAGLVPETPDDPDAERRARDTANRLLSTLKAVLNYAFRDEANKIPSDNAWRRVKPFENVGAAREDHFSASEVRALIAATKDKHFKDLLAGLFLTGARYGELAACDCRHLDGETLTIPSGKTGVRVVTLTDEAAALLRKVKKNRAPGEPLFVRTDEGARWGKSEQHRPMKRALKAAGLPASASVYSLRHSHISRAIEAGVPLTIIAENCGTSVRMIELNYAKAIAKVRRQLLNKVGPALRLVRGPQVRKVA